MDSNKTLEHIYFQQLKNKVKDEVKTHLQIRKEFKDWSGNDIRYFQDDLEEKCKSTVSEKWVYLHFKNDNKKLPRVDVLNLLSQYCGYKNWDDFKFQNEIQKPTESKTSRKWIGVVIGVILMTTSLFWVSSNTHQVTIVFSDAYTHQPIRANDLQLEFTNPKTKISKTTNLSVLIKINEIDSLLVDGAYYKAKKVIVNTDEDTLIVELLPDDYALMLNYFSRAKSLNWEKRSRQLNNAIHDDAKLFQVHPHFDGIEMLNKQEFIERLILPVNSLKNLKILHIIYKDNQIYRLRFVQKIDENENK